MGHRIARAYYAHASDKPRAIQDILNVNNDNAASFLERSGWRADEDCTVESAQPRRE